METLRTNQRPSTTINVQRRLSSKRPSRARMPSSTLSIDDDRLPSLGRHASEQSSVRNAGHFADKFDKWDMYELLATRDVNWLLTNSETYKVSTSASSGWTVPTALGADRKSQRFNSTTAKFQRISPGHFISRWRDTSSARCSRNSSIITRIDNRCLLSQRPAVAQFRSKFRSQFKLSNGTRWDEMRPERKTLSFHH